MPSSLPRGLAALACWRGAEHTIVMPFVVKSPRWRRDGDGGSMVMTFFNKRLSIYLLWAALLLLAGLGGEEEKWSVSRRMMGHYRYPSGGADVSLEWKDLRLFEAPWRSSSASVLVPCCFNKHLFRVGASRLGVAALLHRGGSGEEDGRLGSGVLREDPQAAIFGEHEWQQFSVVADGAAPCRGAPCAMAFSTSRPMCQFGGPL